MKNSLFALLILLSGCGGGGSSSPSVPSTFLQLTKTGIVDTLASESTPVLFNGRLLLITSIRIGVAVPKLRIWDFNTRSLISEFDAPQAITLPCAFVNSGQLYIFGITNLNMATAGVVGHANQIISISTSDLTTWSTPMTVYTFPSDIAGYNLSVTAAPGGQVMAYDFGGDGFSPQWQQGFLSSTDLTQWVPITGHFETSPWSSAVTLRYLDGYYYLFYSTQDNAPHYYTMAARSTDLIGWEPSIKGVLFPDQGFEGINTTDMDLVEDQGTTFISYTVGNQSGNASVATAQYAGTFAQMATALFAP